MRLCHFLLSVIALLLALHVQAQNDDSTRYRENRVKTIIVGVMIPVLKNNHDTCLFRVSYINPQGLADSITEDQNCLGWDRRSQYYFKYDSLNRMTGMDIVANDQIESRLTLNYDSLNRIKSENYLFFGDEPSANSTVLRYFGPALKPDSIHYTTITGKDTIRQRKRHFYSDTDTLVRIEQFSGDANRMVSMTVYKYDSQNRLIRFEYSNFESYNSDQVTTFIYDEDNRIIRSEDQLINSAAQFYYYENGLLGKAFYYNRLGATEREEIYFYQYYGK